MKIFFGALLLLALGSPALHAQTPDDISTERHFTASLADAKVRVFALNLAPTQRIFIRHDHNYAMITLNGCELVIWNEGQSDVLNYRLDPGDIRFVFGGVPGGLRNDRSKDCQMVIVEFLDPAVTTFGYQPSQGGWDYGANVVGPAVDPQAKYESTLSLQKATLKRVQLLSGDDLPPPSEKSDELLVALTDLDLKMGNTRIRKSSGEAFSLPARKAKLTNASGDPARFALIEFR